MMVALIWSFDLLPLSRELMSDLVLPHAYTWHATALELFLEPEAVGWV